MHAKENILTTCILILTQMYTMAKEDEIQIGCQCQASMVRLFGTIPVSRVPQANTAKNFQIEYGHNHTWTSGDPCYSAIIADRRIEVDCDMWEIDSKKMRAPIRPSEIYKLRITYTAGKVPYILNNLTPPQWDLYNNMFHCYADHDIRNLTAHNVSENSIAARWKANELNKPYRFYLDSHTISLTSKDVSQIYHVPVIDCDTCTYLLTNLAPCTDYTICIDTVFMDDYHRQWTTCINATTGGECLTNHIHSKPVKTVLIVISIIVVIIFIVVLSTRRRISELRTSFWKTQQSATKTDEDILLQWMDQDILNIQADIYIPYSDRKLYDLTGETSFSKDNSSESKVNLTN